MRIVENITEIRTEIKNARRTNKTIALVPTMGFLHQGHLSIVREARLRADLVVVSIFLNPTQFNSPSDFEKYPRDLEQDLALLRSEEVDIVFCPPVSEIYAPDAETWVSLDGLAKIHEGEFRPGHFRGVSTVVNILFNIVSPDLALFGEKDFQQLGLIKKMVTDLHMPIEVLGCPTIREADGLAMSSRNVRLSPKARELAPGIFQGLSHGREVFLRGETSAQLIEKEIAGKLPVSDLLKTEYIRVINSNTFERCSVAAAGNRIVLAVWIDGIRLIDNIALV